MTHYLPSSPEVLPDFRVSIALVASWSFWVPSSHVFFQVFWDEVDCSILK